MGNLSDCLQAALRRMIEATIKAYRLDYRLAIAGGLWYILKDNLLEGISTNDFLGFHQGGWILYCSVFDSCTRHPPSVQRLEVFLAQAH